MFTSFPEKVNAAKVLYFHIYFIAESTASGQTDYKKR